MIILIDEREKKPYSFPGMETETALLNYGDYAVKDMGYYDVNPNTGKEEFYPEFAVERKSLDDFARSVGTDRKRFEREIDRAQQADHFAVVIEASPDDAYKGSYYSKIHPNAVIGTAKKWPYKYGTLDVVWVGETDEGHNIPLSHCREAGKQETLRLLDKWYIHAATDLF
ncbi:ERCC4 domain-containing protein [Haloterrigena salifodinae]|uniref:ERCC4 domain-containing protein n=1 Tax=Haloterrigena salifodinae TaxID=2675099 RepID=A0A8T8E0K9_9EURY|nr:ERCC4 domain-containing protein [Haloterrigena salifodinae]QRV15063.1 ERCC4 domain-containing protein [Haloterrigena salifodinae]